MPYAFHQFSATYIVFPRLDLASFFIPDRGEKLCFKVTVLLGISVLLLILNDILPSKSHRCPLIGKSSVQGQVSEYRDIFSYIRDKFGLSYNLPLLFCAAVYVVVIFSFMLLSLLETILVIYIINMNSEDHSSDTGIHIFHASQW